MCQKGNMNRPKWFGALSILLASMVPGLAFARAMSDGKGSDQVRNVITRQNEHRTFPRLGPNSASGGSDLVVKSGTWLSLTSGVRLSLGGNLSIGGVIAPSVGTTVIFNGRGPQTEAGFAVFPDVMKTGGGMLTLNNPIVISGTLALVSGDISLSGFSLPVNSISGGSAASYIVTPDTASGLVRPVSSAASVLFPVGNTSYNPVSIRTSTGSDLFRVSVVDSLMPTTPNKETALKRTWLIYQSNPPGTNGSIVFSVQWNAGEEGSQFDRSLGGAGSADGWRWRGSAWVKQNGSRFFDNGLTVYPAVDSLSSTTMGIWTLANESGALPIQLASFTAMVVNGCYVRLDWTTLSEVNNYGFEVQRRGGVDSSFHSLPGIFVPGHGTTNEPHSYSFVDSTVGRDSVHYRLKQIDLDGATHYSDPVSVLVPTEVSESDVTSTFALEQNYPNPFNPSTVISYSLPHSSHVKLVVYNIIGQEVAQLVNQQQEAGRYEVTFHPEGLASGIYFYSLQSPEGKAIRKLTLVR